MSGFKQFVLRGNVVDMSVGVVVGGAFTAVVAALTKDLLTPMIAALVGKPDFSAIRFTVNGSVFALGDFINALVSFLLIAAVIYFCVILPINALTTEGSKLIRKVFADHARGMEDELSCLDDYEKEILKSLLRKVNHAAGNGAPSDSSFGQNLSQNKETTGKNS
ncbi:MAG TPA: large conductance mechanosensitive channel protein MscL [Terriglobales bacterium]|nr:large conductance mechanosensitive channel protein MscL [Terriglobales bacterium]